MKVSGGLSAADGLGQTCRNPLQLPQRHSNISNISNTSTNTDTNNGSISTSTNDRAGHFEQGDRVGVLLDLDDGSLRFFKNGVQHGSGYAAGSVTGPVVAAVQMYGHNDSVRLLPNAQQPE